MLPRNLNSSKNDDDDDDDDDDDKNNISNLPEVENVGCGSSEKNLTPEYYLIVYHIILIFILEN